MSQRLKIWTIAQKCLTKDKNVKKEEKNEKHERKMKKMKKDENKKIREQNSRNNFQFVLKTWNIKKKIISLKSCLCFKFFRSMPSAYSTITVRKFK